MNGRAWTGRPWTQAEVSLLIELMDEGATFAMAARSLNRGPQAAKKKWATMHEDRIGSADTVRPIVVPPECWADRDRRLNAPQRTLIGAVVGDPPLGYSALDRQGTAKRRTISLSRLRVVDDDASGQGNEGGA